MEAIRWSENAYFSLVSAAIGSNGASDTRKRRQAAYMGECHGSNSSLAKYAEQ